jgi:hypothetical protein
VTYGDSVVFFSWYQTPGHPELQTGAGEARSARYNVGGLWPSAFFDGFYRAEQVEDSFYYVFRGKLEQARSQPTVLEMTLDTADTRIDSTQANIRVRITPTDSAVDRMNTLMLVTVIYEDSASYYSQLQGDSGYARFCVRRVLSDTWGIPLHLRFGEDFDTLLTTSLGDWNRARVGAAVFVQDTTSMRVLQSVVKRKFED